MVATRSMPETRDAPMDEPPETPQQPRCVAGALEPFREPENNTLRGARWSPDGLCLLTASEDRHLRLFELPEQLQSHEGLEAAGAASEGADRPRQSELPNPLTVLEGDSIYDFCWYPAMDSSDAATCCFLSSSRDHPVRLWDAYTGRCRGSYVAHNHLDELTAAHSLSFDPSGGKIYCGFERCVRIFDIARPGRECETRPTCKSRKSRDGQRGIISCFAFAPDFSGLYAAGSFAGTTGLYVEGQPGLIFELGQHGGGVTQLRFSSDAKLLYSAARRDDCIRCWDVRMSCKVLASFERPSPTNQRIGFTLVGGASEGLVTASHDGRVLAFSTTAPAEPPTTLLTFADTTSDVSMHPSLPLLAVATGERRYHLPAEDDEPAAQCTNGLSVWLMPHSGAPTDTEGVQPPESQAEPAEEDQTAVDDDTMSGMAVGLDPWPDSE